LPVSDNIAESKKIIDFVIEALPESVDRVIFVVDHLKEQIESYVTKTYGDEKKIKKSFVFVEQGEMKGTFGALSSAKPYITSEQFLVLNGDDIVDRADLENIITEKAALGVYTKIMPGYYAVESDAENNFVGFREQNDNEKEHGATIATGVYVLSLDFFDIEPVGIFGGEFGLPQMLPSYAKSHPIKVVPMKVWHPVNNIEDLARLQRKYISNE
jgi:NDP-sugar pyrophosphorylase family protein